MAKRAIVTAAAAEPVALPEYRLKPGTEWVNGNRVKKGVNTVRLSDAEASYGLQLEQIVLATDPDPKSWAPPAPTPVAAEDGAA